MQDPGSEVYRKALQMTKKAPELHAELQRQLAASGEVRIWPQCNATECSEGIAVQNAVQSSFRINGLMVNVWCHRAKYTIVSWLSNSAPD